MKKFIIFLDFDGVICTPRQSLAEGDTGISGSLDPIALTFLNNLCRGGDIYIIISSTWRCMENYSFFSSIFKATGSYDIARSLYYEDWKTPEYKESRGHEIDEWLTNNNDIVDDYLILDDDSDMLESQMNKFIKTDGLNGMLFDNYNDIRNIIKEYRKTK